MTHISFESAINALKIVLNRVLSGKDENDEVASIISSRDQVLTRFQPLFDLENLNNLTEEEFREFLLFKNNLHWNGLHRLGPAICADMNRLRDALKILLNEKESIQVRLNKLIPKHDSAYVPRLGRAVLTPILMISHPEKYGVWNNVSEASMKLLSLWPEMERGLSFGDRYEKVNAVLLEVAENVGIDLWTLDSLWWRTDLIRNVVSSEKIGDLEDVPQPDF